jgi:hypothetical protein
LCATFSTVLDLDNPCLAEPRLAEPNLALPYQDHAVPSLGAPSRESRLTEIDLLHVTTFLGAPATKLSRLSINWSAKIWIACALAHAMCRVSTKLGKRSIGYPFHGLLTSDFTVTAGIVSSLSRLLNDTRFLQISAPIQPGNSGGPLLDTSGHVVGVVTEKLNALKFANATGNIPETISFAVNGALRDFLIASSPIKQLIL